MKRPLFAPIGPRTILAFVVSVPFSFFLVALIALLLQAVGSGAENFTAVTESVLIAVFGSLIVGAVMLVPAFVFGLPLYKFIKAQIGIALWTCLIFGGVVSAAAPFLLFVLAGDVYSPLLLFFAMPGMIAGFIFHRVDQGHWFKTPPTVHPEDVF